MLFIITIKGHLSDFWVENLKQLIPDLQSTYSDDNVSGFIGSLTDATKDELLKILVSMDIPIISIEPAGQSPQQ